MLIMNACVAQAQPRDSVTVPVSLQYRHPGLLNRILLGNNYRKLWETPVRLPVFRLDGFTIKELGGGNQTLSLQLVDGDGKAWVLRTVDKNVKRALPPVLRSTFVLNMTQQQVSAAHPYAPVVVARLARAVGVTAPDPTFYYVSDDPALGEYRPLFANSVCLLEEREAGERNTHNSGKVMERLVDEGSVRPDQGAILRARVLDILVGDWDRHADQWRWAERRESDDMAMVFGIPRDRDQAFFFSDGLLPRFLQVVALRYLVSYNRDLDHWRPLTYKSWPFDRYFLNGLDRGQWSRNLSTMQASLTDSVLSEAVHRLPPEIYARNGKRLLRQLKGRRDELYRKGMRYYHYLCGYVDIYGTDKDDEFVITGSGDSLRVQVFQRKGMQRGAVLYDRRFLRAETRLLRLWGMRGKDRFVSDPGDTRFVIEIATDDGGDEFALDPLKRVRQVKDKMP
ncbi:hypothetical protein EPD60_07290 [Flaviaesturariibacter flavus]|uniref:Uncharacterized protein n=1 Tax=Flaviaesturariibacter flavus TaxID=2502780 RepID=A0A4R1BH65_9BACT|nr:hypothetical protein [Flaviaesturariibacter flavus]TCJ16541.1 hypothetical protein EPD60_07290 [Flaviaesturariibacter flavus]